MTYTLTRRTVLGCAGAALVLPATARASDSASRRFRVIRDGSDIGSHTINVTREGDTVRARTDIDIAVKFLGITAYRYALEYEELYRGGLLESLNGRANDDGDAGYVNASRSGDALSIEGSRYTGPAPSDAVPTSYWRKAGLQSASWISAQTGKMLPITVAQGTTSGAAIPSGAQVWNVADNDDYQVELWYDAAGDWVGCAFDAGGELGVYRLEPGSASLAAFAS